MKGDELRLNLEQARVLLTQFRCTSAFRKWRLLEIAIMANHIHLVVNVHSDPDPETIKRDFGFTDFRERRVVRCEKIARYTPQHERSHEHQKQKFGDPTLGAASHRV